MGWRWGRREGRGFGNRMWRDASNGESSLCAPPLRVKVCGPEEGGVPGIYLHGNHFKLHDADTKEAFFSKFTLKSYHSRNRLKTKQ